MINNLGTPSSELQKNFSVLQIDTKISATGLYIISIMPTVCSAYGCTYRHKKGDNIGMYCFPKNENLRRLWTVAVRRSNWKPTPTSRICGKHFQSGTFHFL